MPNTPTITIEAYDSTVSPSKQIFSYLVPWVNLLNVQQLLESAFMLNQTETTPDPFLFSVEYYGFSMNSEFPGYLGYELKSINALVGNIQNYWSLAVNGVVANTGMDTTFPNPGGVVSFTYTSSGSSLRQKAIAARRAVSAKQKR